MLLRGHVEFDADAFKRAVTYLLGEQNERAAKELIVIGELHRGSLRRWPVRTAHPSRGDILFYPGGISETEILIVHGSASFASKMGDLAGNHFITIAEGRERLFEFGEYVLWHGAQDITFSSIP